MSTNSTLKPDSVRVCVKVAIVVLLLTGLLPVVFFHFPGPRFMPFSYEGMWAFTHVLWKPLRLLIDGSPDLRQHVNPYLVAPLLNAALAFVLACCLLWLLRKYVRKKTSHDS
jgi:hypothetical protein